MNSEFSPERAAAERAVKEQEWQRLTEEADKIADRLGEPIDAGIKETVIGLWAHGFTTGQSCEGHDDRAEALPWVSVEAPEPEGWKDNPELAEQWKRENEALASRFQEILNEWHQQRTDQGEQIPDDLRLVEAPQGIYGAFRIESGSQEHISKLPPRERATSVPPHREEMKRFTEYLKERFLGSE